MQRILQFFALVCSSFVLLPKLGKIWEKKFYDTSVKKFIASASSSRSRGSFLPFRKKKLLEAFFVRDLLRLMLFHIRGINDEAYGKWALRFMSEKSIFPYTFINLLFYCFYMFRDFFKEMKWWRNLAGLRVRFIKNIISFGELLGKDFSFLWTQNLSSRNQKSSKAERKKLKEFFLT